MSFTPLTALCPLDGRYQSKMTELEPIFSEYGLIYHRVLVETKWLIHLLEATNVSKADSKITMSAQTFFSNLLDNFSISDAEHIKTLETTTNHDVKAVEYFIKEKIVAHNELKSITEFVHFGCTSEDINNLSYALMLKAGRKVLLEKTAEIIANLTQFAHEFAEQPMLSRTHGQIASPTTMGKEIANFIARFRRQEQQIADTPILGKFNGAVGNFNAHSIAYPDLNWNNISKAFVESLELQHSAYTTQIEPHDWIAELLHAIARFNTILLDFNRDIWGYISLGYFKQKLKEGEIGSSTMPHKVNPIDFENSEGNLGIANALMNHLANKLPISRWQRDLTDSTVCRNIGLCFGYSHLAYQSALKGISKLELNQLQLEKDLEQSWEVLAEAIQTVMRCYGIENPYEKLKALTRGQKITKKMLHKFIESLDLPKEEKERLLALTPKTYIGNAAQMAKSI